MLTKVADLGGMYNRPPKADQSPNKFRVARNVQPTPDGRLIPRNENAEIPGQDATFRYIHYHTQYDTSMLSVVSWENGPGNYNVELYKDNARVPNHAFALGTSFFNVQNYDVSNSWMSWRKNNTTYFINPLDGQSSKYDGVEVSVMGCQQPIISSTDYVSGGAKFARIIQHCIDFDNNEPVSEYVQFPFNTATFLNIETGGNFLTNIIPNTNVLPSDVLTPNPNTESPYFYSSAVTVYNAGTQDYSVTTTDTNILNFNQLGTYVIVSEIKTSGLVGVGIDALGIALKVKATSPLVLDANNAKYLTLTREWRETTIASAAMATAIIYGTRNFLSLWCSDNANGNYVFRGIIPAFPESSVSRIGSISVSSVTTPSASSPASLYLFNISANLGDWYSTVSRKLSPNGAANFGGQFKGLATYQDLLLLWTDDLIWFSDTSLGGTFEQLNTTNFIRVGDTEFGAQISCCGTQDFMLISRQRKNYYLLGTMETGNYKIQEIPDIEIGCWSNNSSILIKDCVYIMTAIGLFQMTSGGRITNISGDIPKNFSRYDGYDVNEDVVFTLLGTDVTSDTTKDLGLSIAFDEYRDLLVFMRKGAEFAGNPCLVLSTKSGELYEWNGLVSGPTLYASAIGFKSGLLYVSNFSPVALTLEAKTFLEDVTIPLNYPVNYPIQLFSTWTTGGEPSLEKILLQLKIFGRIYSDGNNSINVVHYKDWDFTTKVTDKTYFPISDSQYGHKQRFNSDKVLAASYGFEVTTSGVKFELEAIEVEFNGIQQGMKK